MHDETALANINRDILDVPFDIAQLCDYEYNKLFCHHVFPTGI